MAEDRASIDGKTIFDLPADRRVDFSGEVGRDWYDFSVTWSVLEALSGMQVDAGTDRVALFGQHHDAIAKAAAKALARAPVDEGRITVDEGDIL